MSKPRFVNVFVGRDETGRLYSLGGVPSSTRLEADCRSVGWLRGIEVQPNLRRNLRAAGVAFRVVVRMKEGRA